MKDLQRLNCRQLILHYIDNHPKDVPLERWEVAEYCKRINESHKRETIYGYLLEFSRTPHCLLKRVPPKYDGTSPGITPHTTYWKNEDSVPKQRYTEKQKREIVYEAVITLFEKRPRMGIDTDDIAMLVPTMWPTEINVTLNYLATKRKLNKGPRGLYHLPKKDRPDNQNENYLVRIANARRDKEEAASLAAKPEPTPDQCPYFAKLNREFLEAENALQESEKRREDLQDKIIKLESELATLKDKDSDPNRQSRKELIDAKNKAIAIASKHKNRTYELEHIIDQQKKRFWVIVSEVRFCFAMYEDLVIELIREKKKDEELIQMAEKIIDGEMTKDMDEIISDISDILAFSDESN